MQKSLDSDANPCLQARNCLVICQPVVFDAASSLSPIGFDYWSPCLCT